MAIGVFSARAEHGEFNEAHGNEVENTFNELFIGLIQTAFFHVKPYVCSNHLSFH